MLKLVIAATTALTLAAPLHAGSWTVEGSNGGSGSGATSCDRSDGAATCTTTGSWTGAEGRTKTWTTERRISRGHVEATKSVNGFDGRDRAVNWTRKRSN